MELIIQKSTSSHVIYRCITTKLNLRSLRPCDGTWQPLAHDNKIRNWITWRDAVLIGSHIFQINTTMNCFAYIYWYALMIYVYYTWTNLEKKNYDPWWLLKVKKPNQWKIGRPTLHPGHCQAAARSTVAKWDMNKLCRNLCKGNEHAHTPSHSKLGWFGLHWRGDSGFIGRRTLKFDCWFMIEDIKFVGVRERGADAVDKVTQRNGERWLAVTTPEGSSPELWEEKTTVLNAFSEINSDSFLFFLFPKNK